MLCLRLVSSGRPPLKVPCGYAFYQEEEKAVRTFYEISKILGASIIASVGDIVTFNLVSNNLLPSIAVIDGKTKRAKKLDFKDLEKSFDTVLCVKNPPSTITVQALGILNLASIAIFKGKRVLIVVDGEEDLLVIPLIFYLPQGSIIIYGLIDTALVALPVTSYLKKSILKFVKEYFVIGEC